MRWFIHTAVVTCLPTVTIADRQLWANPRNFSFIFSNQIQPNFMLSCCIFTTVNAFALKYNPRKSTLAIFVLNESCLDFPYESNWYTLSWSSFNWFLRGASVPLFTILFILKTVYFSLALQRPWSRWMLSRPTSSTRLMLVTWCWPLSTARGLASPLPLSMTASGPIHAILISWTRWDDFHGNKSRQSMILVAHEYTFSSHADLQRAVCGTA